MLKLKLDIFDVILEFAIKGLAREPDEHDDEEEFHRLWTLSDFRLHGRFINYDMRDSELLMTGEITYLQHCLDDLLNNEIKDDCSLGFAEPDLVFHFYPAKRLYDEPGRVAYRNGYTDRELFAELTVQFWCKEGGLGGNSFTMTLYKPEIEAFLIYLKTVTKELTEDNKDVQRLIQSGILIKE